MLRMMNPATILSELDRYGNELYMNRPTGTIQKLSDWYSDYKSDTAAQAAGQLWEEWASTLILIDCLQELTGQESGIVIYHETGEALALNWSRYEGLPRLFGGGVIGIGPIPAPVDAFKASGEAVRSRMEGIHMVYDETDGACTDPGESRIWNLSNDGEPVSITVIAPLGWN